MICFLRNFSFNWALIYFPFCLLSQQHRRLLTKGPFGRQLDGIIGATIKIPPRFALNLFGKLKFNYAECKRPRTFACVCVCANDESIMVIEIRKSDVRAAGTDFFSRQNCFKSKTKSPLCLAIRRFFWRRQNSKMEIMRHKALDGIVCSISRFASAKWTLFTFSHFVACFRWTNEVFRFGWVSRIYRWMQATVRVYYTSLCRQNIGRRVFSEDNTSHKKGITLECATINIVSKLHDTEYLHYIGQNVR